MTALGATAVGTRRRRGGTNTVACEGVAAGRHAQDDWLDQLPGQHRFVFDTTQFEGFGGAMLYANNFFLANQNGYSLGNTDLAVVLVVRHNSTVFAFTDAIWAKYGAPMSERSSLKDPVTKQAPKLNIFNAPALAAQLPSNGPRSTAC